MQIIVVLIVISLFIAGSFLFAFFWAIRDGQYDDDFTPSMRILIDDDMLPANNEGFEENNIKTLKIEDNV